VCQIDSVATLTRFGTYSYIILFLAGLVTLAYMILGVKSIKTYWLLLVLSLIAVLLTQSTVMVFYLVSTVLLSYVFTHFLVNY